MSTKNKVALTVLAFAIVGFLLNPATPVGRAVWGPSAEMGVAPTPAQLGLLMGVSLVQAVGFGAGVAVLLFGGRYAARVFARRAHARIAHLGIAWSLLSWVPHGAMHQTAGFDLGKLIVVEYLFHVSLVLAAAGLGWALVEEGRARAAPQQAPAPSMALATARATVVRPPARP